MRLRPWTYADLPCVESATRDPRIPDGTTVPPTYSEAEGRAWIRRQWQRAEQADGLSLAVTSLATDEAAGAAVLLHRPQPATAGIGYWIVPAARHRGLATRAVGLLAQWALIDGGLDRVEALVEVDNHASQGVLERAGFSYEGRLRSYLVLRGGRQDALIYSLLRSDLPSSGAWVEPGPRPG